MVESIKYSAIRLVVYKFTSFTTLQAEVAVETRAREANIDEILHWSFPMIL
jgi:hypothetical protein